MAYTTIKKPSDYFNTKLYTGTGATQSITGVGFQPDWNWIKCRSNADSSQIFDVLRTTYALRSDGTNVEAVGNGWTSLDSDGFTLNGDVSGGNVNNSGRTYASWNWKANGAGSSNTDGSITSTVSANTTSGFSIVSYTGTGSAATIGHGLGVTPKMIIIKGRSIADNWCVYNENIGNTKRLRLNSNIGETTDANAFNNTSPTSSVFNLGISSEVNANTYTYIAYCFAEKKGFSKFGSYTGNGSSDGTFVYTGFKPAFVIIKQTNATRSWHMFDNKRNEFNVVDKFFFANSSGAEQTLSLLDFTSNGFKTRSTDGAVNASGGSYIYMAFAEEPLVGDNPATAR